MSRGPGPSPSFRPKRGTVPMNTVTGRQGATELCLASMQALELLGLGWLVCDSSCRVVGANHVASRILRMQDGMVLNSDGVVNLKRECAETLSDVVQQATRASASPQPTGPYRALLLVKRKTGKRSFTV